MIAAPEAEIRESRATRLATPLRRGFALGLAVLAIVLVGFALRVFGLDSQSLWYDETYAAWIGAQGPATIATQLSPDLLPLHFTIVWLLTLAAGHSEFSVRFSSLCLGTLSLPLFYQVLRQAGARWAAVAGSAALSVSAFAIYYSQEARMEMLACFLGIAATYTLIRAYRRQEPWCWAAYCACVVASFYTFFFTALVLLGLNLALLLWARRPPRAWWLANIAAIILWLPWLVFTALRAGHFLTDRVADVGGSSALGVLRLDTAGLEFGLTGSSFFSGPPSIVLLLMALVAAYRLWRRPSFENLMLLAWALVPTVILDALNFLLPIYQVRYFLVALPGWIAVVLLGFADVRPRRAVLVRASAGLAGFIFLAGSGAALANYYADPHYQRDDYRAAFALIKANALPDEAVIYDPIMQFTAVDFYGSDLATPVVGLPVPLPGHLAVAQIPPSGEDKPATDAKLAQLTQQYDGFWLLLYGDVAQWTENWLDNHRAVVADRYFGSVRLKHYRPAPMAAPGSLANGARVDKDFGPLRLEQARLTALQAGRPLVVDLLWQPSNAPAADYAVSLQLFDPEGRRVAQTDGPPLNGTQPTSAWTPSLTYPDAVRLVAPATLTTGIYHVLASVYDTNLRPAGGQQTIFALPYLPAASHSDPDAASDAGLTLESVRWQRDGSGSVVAAVDGAVQARPSKTYTWFAHLLDTKGQLVGQDDHPPLAPATSWQPGDALSAAFTVADPAAAASQLELGLYDATGARVSFRLPSGELVDHLQVPLVG